MTPLQRSTKFEKISPSPTTNDPASVEPKEAQTRAYYNHRSATPSWTPERRKALQASSTGTKSKFRTGREQRRAASTTREYVKYHTISATKKFYANRSTASKTRAPAQTVRKSAHTTAARPNSTKRRVRNKKRKHAPQNTKHTTRTHTDKSTPHRARIHRSQKCYTPRQRRDITTGRT